MRKIYQITVVSFIFSIFIVVQARDCRLFGLLVEGIQVATAQVTNPSRKSLKIPEPDLNTPPAVSPNERMKVYPSPGEYMAFSLKAAMKRIKGTPASQNYRIIHPEVYNLGGINHLQGLVYDRAAEDVILIGQYNPTREPITLDDLAVALRSRLALNEWPLVSIDPISDPQNPDKKFNWVKQSVRFGGGIEQTQFGADFLDADYRLKKIDMGLLPSGIKSFKTYWDLNEEILLRRRLGGVSVYCRFWFYPVLSSILVREDVVAMKNLSVGIFTEVLAAEINGETVTNLQTFHNEAGDRFAEQVSQRYEELAQFHPSFSRLQGLLELVALSKGIEEMGDPPKLTFWLKDYSIKAVETRKSLGILSRKGELFMLSGGVHLTAIALRLKSGNVNNLKEEVLSVRPHPDAVSWSLGIEEWRIPVPPEALTLTDAVPLLQQAAFLREQKRYPEAIALYGEAIKANNNFTEAYIQQGITRSEQGNWVGAIKDYSQALQIDSSDARAYLYRGDARGKLGDFQGAITDYDQALQMNPMLSEAYNHRGIAYVKLNQPEKAILNYEQAIKLNPNNAEAYVNLGNLYLRSKNYQQAINNYDTAIRINPNQAKVYNNRGLVHAELKNYQAAIADYDQALLLDSSLAMTFSNRGDAYFHLGNYQEAIIDYLQAVSLDSKYIGNPYLADSYFKRGVTRYENGDRIGALEDLRQAAHLFRQQGRSEDHRNAIRKIEEIK